jgi:hypothetical protein
MTFWRKLALTAATLVLVFGGARRASAQDAAAQSSATVSKAECAEAYESAQETRASGQLRKTQERLEFCAQTECPSFVQRDCARWLQEVQRELPSVRITARDWGNDGEAGFRVTLDGQALSPAVAKQAISLDPGRHEFVFERAGREPVTRTILAQQGIQNRVLLVDFQPAVAPDGSPADTGEPGSSSGLRPYAYAAWAVGAVGLGTFAILGTIGRSDKEALKDDCPNVTDDPTAVRDGVCAQQAFDDRQSSIDRTFAFADVGLVAGLIGLAGGTALFFLGPGGSKKDPDATDAGLRLDMGVAHDGARATLQGSF